VKTRESSARWPSIEIAQIQTQITNKQGTYETNTYKTNYRILKLLIITYYNNKLIIIIISNLCVIIYLLKVSMLRQTDKNRLMAQTETRYLNN